MDGFPTGHTGNGRQVESGGQTGSGRQAGSSGDSWKRPGVAQISILFSITIFLFLMVGYRAQYREFYSGVLITELGLIMLPALIYLLVFRYDLKKVLRLNKTSFLNFFLIFWIMALAIPLAGVFNFINLWLVNSIFGKIIVKQIPIAQDIPGLIINILVIGGSAGLCEEFLFRGVIQRGLEKFGAGRAILIAAMLFSLTHLDFQKIFGTFLLGALIGFIAFRTNSLYGSMFAHFTNNSLAVILSFAAAKLMEMFKGSGISMPDGADLNGFFATFGGMPKEQLIIVFFVYGILFLFIAGLFISILFAFLKTNPVRSAPAPQRMASGDKRGFYWLLPGLAFIAIMYFTEVLTFRGVSSLFTHTLRRILGI